MLCKANPNLSQAECEQNRAKAGAESSPRAFSANVGISVFVFL
jgi:hypothetical protein